MLLILLLRMRAVNQSSQSMPAHLTPNSTNGTSHAQLCHMQMCRATRQAAGNENYYSFTTNVKE